MSIDLSALIDPVKAIASAAGERVMAVYDRNFDVQHKDDKSPLTEADLASHRYIVDRLEKLTPNIPILSEESAAEIPVERRLAWQRFWLVDPLDGTKEFIKRNGEFTVNIALVEGNRPVLGVVHVPAMGVTYFGAEGFGAQREDAEGRRSIHVRAPCGSPLRVVGSRSHAGPHLEGYLTHLGEHEMVPKGSSLKLCLVAEGAADCYPRFGPTSEWDTAAAQVVVESAGGKVVNLDDRPLTCNEGESVLNPYFLVYGDTAFDWFSAIPEEIRPAV